MVATITAGHADLDRILAASQLPALPQSAIRILELSQNPKNGPSEFAIPIEADPGLAGQVLKFVNSSYFGFAREISSVKLAITMVGIRTIKNFTLWSAVFSLMPNPKCGPFDLRTLWQDSLRRALFARAFARLLGVRDVEEPFAAALLQDMAVPLLAKERSGEYVKLLERRRSGKQRLSQLEREHFGWTHADAGSQMARRWNLPEEFADLIGCHSELECLSAGEESCENELAVEPSNGGMSAGRLAVALSSLLPPVTDDVWHERDQFVASYERFCPADGPSIEQLLESIDQEFVEFAPVLKVAAPAKTLVARYSEAGV